MSDKEAAATGWSRPVQPHADRPTPDRDPAAPPTPTPAPNRPTNTPIPWRRWLWPAAAAVSFLLLFTPNPFAKPATDYTYSQFAAAVTANQVKQVSINPDGAVTGTLTSGSTFHSQLPTALGDTGITQSLQAHHVAIVATATATSWLSVLVGWLPMLVLIGLFVWTSRTAMKSLASGIGGFGRARTKVVDAERPTTRFADVAGYAGAKREIEEVVDYLSDPSRYEAVGATGPRGVLLVGPPGTGKTMLARAVAGEAKVPFLSVSGSGFVEMFVGVGASRVRDLFAEARRRGPAIVFIDEIDAIGGGRGAVAVGGHDEREQTLNQLLAEMDGFEQATGVVVIAATNRPETLDAALLRPGRFDRQVVVALPTLADRIEILKVHTAGKPLLPSVDLNRVARSTPGFSGADLANLVNEAAIHTVRAHRQFIEPGDISAARDRILIGRREDSNALLPEEKHAVAVHEAGHALVALLSPNADPVDKVTILPAGAALGVTQQLPEVERHLYSESYLRDSLAVRLGGRAAELVVFGEGSTGAADDLAGATELATRMVTEFGLSEALGPVGYGDPAQRYLPGALGATRPVSEATQCVIDIEVAELMRAAESTAKELLTIRRDTLDELTGLLLELETIDADQVRSVLHTPANIGVPGK